MVESGPASVQPPLSHASSTKTNKGTVSERLALDEHGVLWLAENGNEVPAISTETIAEHSKADALSKTLACLQASFLIFQTIGRLAAKLPVTTLEVNTISHVLCALGMYFFWYHKPLNAGDPIPLRRSLATSQLVARHSIPLGGRERRSLVVLSGNLRSVSAWTQSIELASFVEAHSNDVTSQRRYTWLAQLRQTIPHDLIYPDLFGSPAVANLPGEKTALCLWDQVPLTRS